MHTICYKQLDFSVKDCQRGKTKALFSDSDFAIISKPRSLIYFVRAQIHDVFYKEIFDVWCVPDIVSPSPGVF